MENKLTRLAGFEGVKGPVLTVVMDGIGLAPETVSNAVATAYTPNLDMLMAKYPTVSLKAHGTAVGLTTIWVTLRSATTRSAQVRCSRRAQSS